MNVENPKVWKVYREREKKEKQTNREKRGIIKVRSDKRLGTERVKGKETSTSGGKECQHTSGYDAFFFFYLKTKHHAE